MAKETFRGAPVRTPASHGGREELDSQVESACGWRQGRNGRSDAEAARRSEFSRGNELLKSVDGDRGGEDRRNEDGRQRSAHGAAIGLYRHVRSGGACAATVRRPVGLLEADSIGRKQAGHQQDGHRSPKESASRHRDRLPRGRRAAVIRITLILDVIISQPGIPRLRRCRGKHPSRG